MIKKNRIHLFILLFICTGSCALFAGEDSKPNTTQNDEKFISFQFMPEDKETYTQLATISRKFYKGDTLIKSRESRNSMHITVSKKKDGWELLFQPVAMAMTENGKEIKNPVENIISSLELTYILDFEGKIVRILGMDKLYGIMKETFTKEVMSKLEKVINVNVLKERSIQEWNGRIGDFSGLKIKPGEKRHDVSTYHLPDGSEMDYNVTTTFTGPTPCGKNSCLIVEQNYDSESDISKFTEQEVKKVTDEKVQVNLKGTIIKGHLKRIVDPATMRIYREESERTIKTLVKVDQEEFIPVTTVEERKILFQYTQDEILKKDNK